MLAYVRKTEGFRARNYVQSARHSLLRCHRMQYLDDLAGEFGVKPNMAALLVKDPKLLWAQGFHGPFLPHQFRLNGSHKWNGAREAILNYKNRCINISRIENKYFMFSIFHRNACREKKPGFPLLCSRLQAKYHSPEGDAWIAMVQSLHSLSCG
ncbi:dimethylaniline monooxygenase [Trichonephila clavipes]|nr:dimethylaniline monooxygenase [Trichonephila clavipes]